MIDLTINQEQLERTVQRARERNIIIPTFAQMKDPALIPDGVKARLENVGLWDVNSLNLFRITWKNEPKDHGGGFNGINYVELQVGIDGIAVMTNANNSAVECVSFADIYGLVGPESTGIGTWAGANAISSELGGAGDLPDAPLDIFGPGEESGTFDSFIEIVLEDFADERGQDATTRPDYNPSGDDTVILQGIQGSDTSFGWVGFAFAANASDVKLLQVDDGESGCVEANPDTIASNEYPVSRPLFIYVNTDKAAESAALSTFVDFFMADGLDVAVSEVGYVALTDDAKSTVRSTWGG